MGREYRVRFLSGDEYRVLVINEKILRGNHKHYLIRFEDDSEEWAHDEDLWRWIERAEENQVFSEEDNS